MNTAFLTRQALHPDDLRCIEIDRNELKLLYGNDSAVELEFADEDELDRFVGLLVTSLIQREVSEKVMWN